MVVFHHGCFSWETGQESETAERIHSDCHSGLHLTWETTESTIRLVGATTVLGNGLVAEEVLAVQAATEFLQEA